MAEENEAVEENLEAAQVATEPETKERGSSENLRVLENIEVKLTVEVGSTEYLHVQRGSMSRSQMSPAHPQNYLEALEHQPSIQLLRGPVLLH